MLMAQSRKTARRSKAYTCSFGALLGFGHVHVVSCPNDFRHAILDAHIASRCTKAGHRDTSLDSKSLLVCLLRTETGTETADFGLHLFLLIFPLKRIEYTQHGVQIGRGPAAGLLCSNSLCRRRKRTASAQLRYAMRVGACCTSLQQHVWPLAPAL